MKKLIAIMLALACVVVFSASAFAAAASGVKNFGSAIQTGEDMTYALSNKVWMDYNGNAVAYAIGCKHYSGNRIFYTTDSTSNIFYQEQDTYKGSSAIPSMPARGATTITGMTAM